MNKAEFMKVVERVAELVDKKGQDYNGRESVHDYFPFHHKSYVQMLWVKLMRILHVTKKQDAGEKLNFETAQDSVEDLLAYTVFYLDYLQKEKLKRLVPHSNSGQAGIQERTLVRNDEA